MRIVDLELRIENTDRKISRIVRNGRIYVVSINEKFDLKSRNDLRDLTDALNYELNRNGVEKVEFQKVEKDLRRLIIGKKGIIRTD